MANSVSSWNQCNAWSARHESAHEASSARAPRQARECATGSKTCPLAERPLPAPPPMRLYPRDRAVKTGVIFQFFPTLMNVACWLIPLTSKKISENRVALSLANSFLGGVFFCLAFGHLLPECTHAFEGMNEATPYMLCRPWVATCL